MFTGLGVRTMLFCFFVDVFFFLIFFIFILPNREKHALNTWLTQRGRLPRSACSPLSRTRVVYQFFFPIIRHDSDPPNFRLFTPFFPRSHRIISAQYSELRILKILKLPTTNHNLSWDSVIPQNKQIIGTDSMWIIDVPQSFRPVGNRCRLNETEKMLIHVLTHFYININRRRRIVW